MTPLLLASAAFDLVATGIVVCVSLGVLAYTFGHHNRALFRRARELPFDEGELALGKQLTASTRAQDLEEPRR